MKKKIMLHYKIKTKSEGIGESLFTLFPSLTYA